MTVNKEGSSEIFRFLGFSFRRGMTCVNENWICKWASFGRIYKMLMISRRCFNNMCMYRFNYMYVLCRLHSKKTTPYNIQRARYKKYRSVKMARRCYCLVIIQKQYATNYTFSVSIYQIEFYYRLYICANTHYFNF